MSAIRMVIIGVGDGGCSALENMARAWPEHPPMIAVNTELHEPGDAPGITHLQIGAALLKGAGAGGDPRLGQRAMEGDMDNLRPLIHDAGLILLVTGLGGGTGTGAAPVILAEARKNGSLTLALAMLPFEFESRRRREQAEQSQVALRNAADGLICLPNQRLLALSEDQTNIEQLFAQANRMLGQCLQSLWHMLTRRGIINVGFTDLCTLIREGNGRCLMACACADGAGKAEKAAEKLLRHPLLEGGAALRNNRGLLLNITGGPDLTLRDVNVIVRHLVDAGVDESLLATGMICDPELKDHVWCMIFVAESAGDKARFKSMPAGDDDKSAPAARRRKPMQPSLFDAVKGRFEGVDPTIMDGENLDTPTYVRRCIPIQKVRDVV